MTWLLKTPNDVFSFLFFVFFFYLQKFSFIIFLFLHISPSFFTAKHNPQFA